MTLRASQLIGAAVVDRQGRHLGRVSDLILEERGAAQLCYALLDIERFADERQRTVAVPWSVLEPGRNRQELRLGVSRTALSRLRGLHPPSGKLHLPGGKDFRHAGKDFR